MMRRIVTSLLILLLLGGTILSALAETPRFQTRALWVDARGFSTAPAADKLIAKCLRSGINVILPNVFCYQTAYFKSSHFRGWVAVNDEFDALAYLLRQAHAAKIQVQAWCCVYYEGGQEPSNPGWLDRSFDGRPFEKNFISPANPEVNPYLLAVFKDLLAYDIDGIHLDYIRYPCTAFDYSAPARKAFESVSGFDPQNFLDHPELIVPPEKEKFPVRVLHAASHIERIWETTAIERTLDSAGVGFAFISEAPENISALRAPGLLIVSGYNQPMKPMLQAIQQFVERGGSVLWSDVPVKALQQFPELEKMTGLSAGKWMGLRQVSLQALGKDAQAMGVTTNALFITGSTATKLTDAVVLVKRETGEPAITLKEFGKGRVLVTGFDAMDLRVGRGVPIVRGMVDWLKSRADSVGPDLPAKKRAEWVQWRGDQVTRLVRDISVAAKAKSPRLVVTSSGGPGAWEFYGCYRDARRWLAEGINDMVFPMNYTPDPTEFADMLSAQAEAAPAGKFDRIFPGVQLYNRGEVDGKKVTVPIDAHILQRELQIVGLQGYQGFCLFADDYLTDEIIKTVRQFSDQTK